MSGLCSWSQPRIVDVLSLSHFQLARFLILSFHFLSSLRTLSPLCPVHPSPKSKSPQTVRTAPQLTLCCFSTAEVGCSPFQVLLHTESSLQLPDVPHIPTKDHKDQNRRNKSARRVYCTNAERAAWSKPHRVCFYFTSKCGSGLPVALACELKTR